MSALTPPRRPARACRRALARLALPCLLAAWPLAGLAEAAVQQVPGGWQIRPQGDSRAELVRQLARASGSVLHGDLQALAQAAAPRWPLLRATTLDDAWHALLAGAVNHARRCSASGCTVWIVGSVPPRQARTAAPAPGPGPTPQVDPPGLFPAD